MGLRACIFQSQLELALVSGVGAALGGRCPLCWACPPSPQSCHRCGERVQGGAFVSGAAWVVSAGRPWPRGARVAGVGHCRVLGARSGARPRRLGAARQLPRAPGGRPGGEAHPSKHGSPTRGLSGPRSLGRASRSGLGGSPGRSGWPRWPLAAPTLTALTALTKAALTALTNCTNCTNCTN